MQAYWIEATYLTRGGRRGSARYFLHGEDATDVANKAAALVQARKAYGGGKLDLIITPATRYCA